MWVVYSNEIELAISYLQDDPVKHVPTSSTEHTVIKLIRLLSNEVIAGDGGRGRRVGVGLVPHLVNAWFPSAHLY